MACNQVDSDLYVFAAHQSLLKAYERLQRAKAAFWQNKIK
ncbi:hypothetical protein ACNKHM_02050 [Shigella sonnei]